MAKVSIIIPSRAEKSKNLSRTIESIYENATGEFEVIVGVNGHMDMTWYFSSPIVRSNLKLAMLDRSIGIKPMINTLAAMAEGKYIYKSDAHCSFGKGFDEILQSNMEEDWVVTPRFYVLDGDTWDSQDDRFYDYFYLSCPFTDTRGLRFKAGGHWPERTKERLDIPIDETPQIHGSGWFMTKDRFFELGGFPLQDPYGHGQEPLWIGLKNWLAGGKVMVNKKTWYAHLHQDSSQRGYPEDKQETERTYNMTANYWLRNLWSERRHDFSWFVDKFSPMPTWPDNWKEAYDQWRNHTLEATQHI